MEDTDPFFEMDSDPEVHRYLGTQPIKNKDQIADMIKYIRQQFIGWTGLKLVNYIMNNQTNYYDLGYRLIRKYWGRGFATETAQASLHYGFDTLNLNEIIATVHCENAASNTVVGKLGFTFCQTFYVHELKHNWYKITKSDWSGMLSDKIRLHDN